MIGENNKSYFRKNFIREYYPVNKNIAEVRSSSFQPMMRLRNNAFYMFSFLVVTEHSSEKQLKRRKNYYDNKH